MSTPSSPPGRIVESADGHLLSSNRVGRIVIEVIESRVLAFNRAGDPATRRVPVYLPPSYDASPDRRYPVIYVLAGYSGTGLSYLSYQCFAPNLPERLDGLMASGRMGDAIVVMADGMTRYGGSQYIDSTATGPYQRFVAEETVAHIDARYRTIPTREGRAVAGKSSGGYGALRLAMERGDVFSACACHAGDMYFEYAYLPDIPKAVNVIVPFGSLLSYMEHFERIPKKRGADFTAINMIGMAAAYSAADDGGDGDGLGFWMPFDFETGALREHVWARWLTHDPIRLLDRHADALRALSLLYIDVGSQDEYNLQIGARIMRERLSARGIAHQYEEFTDGHRDTSYRYDVSLPTLRAVLADS